MANSAQNGYKNEHTSKDNESKFIVKYRQDFYDITKFMEKHPGGVNTLKGLENSDMTARFMKAPPHSDAAIYLMKEYKITPPPKPKDKQYLNGKTNSNGNNNNKFLEKGVEILEEDTNNNTNNNNNNIKLDESMEYLVDWSKAMVPQIPKITKYYDEWVHKPVDRPLRLFGPWYLEMCTKTPWWVIPVFWIPVIITCIKDEILSSWYAGNVPKLIFLASYFAFGILFWTFLEYILHRWLFHMKTDESTHPWLCTFHFMIHGLHHKVPFDPQRLVFPPVPGVVIASILYMPVSCIFPMPHFLLGGALFGYLCYDIMHYYLHYGNPTLKHLYHMKRYHYQHHFAHQDQGYGISSPLWDFIFSTRIRLRKLKYQLRWK